MKKYEFTGTNELTKKAFTVYSDSSFTFWKDGDRFYCSDNPNSEKVELGTVADVIEFLEQFADQTKNKYSIIRITRDTAEECEEEFDGQLSDGIFENSRVGWFEEI